MEIEELKKRAEAGDADAQNELGNLYYDGDVVEQNLEEAVYWYTKAAEQGFVPAQFYLALSYANGEGVEQDYKKAVEWWTKAAEQGDASAQYNLGISFHFGNGVEQDYKEAVKWYTKAAEQGDEKAQFNLGTCYANGEGVEQNHEEAVRWYTQAAEQGNASAQYNLGICFYNGEGVEQDYAKAVKWYTKAAEQGDENAQYNLGCCYHEGNGVEQDYKKAVKWWINAAEQKVLLAFNNVGWCFEYGEGVERNSEKALYWYTKGAEQGDASAQNNLGNCYKNGFGTEKNHEKAIYWYTKAAKQGNAYAPYNLGYCFYKGDGVEHDHKKARSYFKQVIENKQVADDTIGAAYYYLGMMCIDRPHYAFKDHFSAKEYFEKAINLGYDCKAELDGVDSELNIDKDNPHNKMGQFAKDILAKKAHINQIYEEVEKTLKSSFEELWDILSKESRTCLITGCVSYISFASSGEENRGNFDYSSIIAAITKACEIELSKVLYYGFRDYLEREKIPPTEFDPETQKFVVENKSAVPKYEKTDEDEEYNYFKQKKYERTSVISYVPRDKTGVFTLGGFAFLAGMKNVEQSKSIEIKGAKENRYQKPKKEIVVDKHFLAYMNEIFKDDAFSRLNRTEEMKKYLFDLKVKIENIAFNLRNPASHDTVMPFWKAVYCGNSVFMDNYFLQDFLRKIKH